MTATPEPTAIPAPTTTLQLVVSNGFKEFSLDCTSGSCRAFENYDMGMRVILFKDGTVGLFPRVSTGHDLDTQLDFVAEVFRMEGMSEGTIDWMYRKAPLVKENKLELNADTGSGVTRQVLMILLPNSSNDMVLTINID